MRTRKLIRKIDKGQATLEMIAMMPYFFYFVFFMLTIAIFWLGFFLNMQAANEAVAAEGAYGGGGAKASQVGAFGASINTRVSSISTRSLPGAFGDFVVLQTSSDLSKPWGVPLITVNSHQATGTSMSPIWQFEPKTNK